MNICNDLETILHQEQTLQLPHFNVDMAWKIGTHLREMAISRGAPITIEVRTFGRQLFYTALEGATPDNARWVRRKVRTAEHFRRSSYAVGLGLQQAETTLAARFALCESEFASHGGAFPLSLKGSGMIGTIAVSGLPQRADHSLVVEALCQILGKDADTLALGPEF